MKAKNKKVFFFVSTPGHMKGVRKLSSVLAGSLGVNVSILNFPGDLAVLSNEKFSAGALSQLQDVDRIFYQVASSVRCKKQSFVSRCMGLLYETLKCVFNLFSMIYFYILLLLNIFYFVIYRALGGDSRHDFLAFSVSRSFILIKNTLPFLQAWLVRRKFFKGLLFSQNFLFGIWGDNKICRDLSELFSLSRPDLIVLPEFNWGYKHHLLSYAARQFNIPVVVMPYTMAGAQEWIVSFRGSKDCRVSGFFRWLLSKSFPSWLADDGVGGKIILPQSWLISCLATDFHPALPWVTNSLDNAIYVVDNEFTRNFYTLEGVDTSSWLVVGSLEEDALKAVLHQVDGVRSSPFVLIGLPPDQFDSVDSSELEFSSYRELIFYMVECVCSAAGQDMRVIVALHPRTQRADVSFLEALNVEITDFPLESIISSAYLYISVSSATIRWAIASEVPVINFDVYHYGYDDYKGCLGVVEVRQTSDFELTLSAMLRGEKLYQECLSAQRVDSLNYFKADGFARERIINVFSSLLEAA